MSLAQRNRSVDLHNFAMVPRADIPRASFVMESSLKTTFDAGWLIPIYCEEILPGDSFELQATIFARLATPLFPIMDNLHLDTFFFFVPNRLLWTNWQRFMGEQDAPTDSISYLVPVVPVTSPAACSIYDYFGLPVVGQVLGNAINYNALPFRAYNMIWNQWFRDQNMQPSITRNSGDGPDAQTHYVLQRRGKRHDYFTSALPWPQKFTAPSLPLGTSAPVRTSATQQVSGAQPILTMRDAFAGAVPTAQRAISNAGGGAVYNTTTVTVNEGGGVYPSNLYADLTAATSATINQLRQAFQIQRLLERDARGGTRYTEIIRSHFGVISPDARLDRPEYIGGGSMPIIITPIAQTSGTGLSGGTTPLGNLAAAGTANRTHGFRGSFTEHGYIIGLASVRADLTYQQGIRRHWRRSTRYDFYFPAFAHLGEQEIRQREIYAVSDATDDVIFGYQERWAEYRYQPSQITGMFRSTTAGTLDAWHLAQRFTSAPTLGATFIQETPPLGRALAANPTNSQILCDIFYRTRATRPMPLYSVPGLLDHF